MNERDEFELPAELEMVLSQPLNQPIPDSALLSRRAIAISKSVQATRAEKTIFAVGALVLTVAIIRMLANWWMSLRFELTISNSVATTVWQGLSGLLSYSGWIVIIGGVLAGGLIFTLGILRKSLSE